MRKLLHSIVLVVMALPCAAQDKGLVNLRFLSFPKSANPEPVQLQIGEGKVIEVKAPSNCLSPVYKAPRLAMWSVGKLELNENQEATFTQYGVSPSIASREQLILLVRKGEKNADGLQVIPLDNSFENFAGGQFFFMNAAKVDIAGIIGGVKFRLEPGKHIFIKPKELYKRGEGPINKVFTQFFYKNASDKAKEFFSSSWPANERARSMVFFYHDGRNQRLRFHTVRDYLPPK